MRKVIRFVSKLPNWFINIIAFFDRAWNLQFHHKDCISIIFADNWFKYNDIISMKENNVNRIAYRCLGKNWYKRIDR